KLEREKLTQLDNERIGKLDEEIGKLIRQERALFLIERMLRPVRISCAYWWSNNSGKLVLLISL
ncbi:MAG: hypothetical protein Q8911_08025, partial [Bacillota bacterium]|nr:hypothetical protein [Bacillota bacterium]